MFEAGEQRSLQIGVDELVLLNQGCLGQAGWESGLELMVSHRELHPGRLILCVSVHDVKNMLEVYSGVVGRVGYGHNELIQL